MRIGIAGFLHESNTFTDEKTTLRHFEEASYHRGDALVPVWRDAHHELGGFIAGCAAENVECVPLLAASATPKGPLTADAYERITGELVDAIHGAMPLDGLLLALHGAMVAEGYPSADSETLRRVRSVIGDDVPLIVSLDMHGNVAPPMVHVPNATIAYRTYPHVDQRARGEECARLMARTVRGEVMPVQACVKIPMVIHIVRQYTGDGVMKAIMDEAARLAESDGVLSVSVLPGYIYADVPHMGVSVIIVADGDQGRAEHLACRLAARIYACRHDLNAALPGVEDAVRQAAATPGLVCLMDAGDNIGGGGPGDSTVLFAALLEEGVPSVCVVLYDPTVAGACAAAGDGARVAVSVGGKTDDRHGRPVAITGIIRRVADGKFQEAVARHGGARDIDQGLTAVIETDDGHTVVVNSLRVMPTSLEQLRSLGIVPEEMNVIIVKGVTAPRAAYDPFAALTIPVDTPGVTQAGPESFHYVHRPKPLYPLDDPGTWQPAPW